MEKNFGRYEVSEEIGQGGMGRVYKAYDPQLRRTLALKLLLSGENAKEADIQRFLREAQATAKLDHPNVVKVYDIGSQQGQPFFTMDYIEGGSLKQYVGKPLPMRQLVEIMIKIGNGIHSAHQAGIIHRDLKPSNIMVDQNNEPKVMDFGLAKMAKASKKLSKTGMIIGTLQYMPPEQAQGLLSAIDKRSDVYSLGAIFYELLTGRPPVSGATSFNIIYSIMEKAPIKPTKIKKRIPKELEDICLKALEKDKKHRYQSVAEFVKDLRAFSKGEAIQATSSGSFGKNILKKGINYQIPFFIALALLPVVFFIQQIRMQSALEELKRKNTLALETLKKEGQQNQLELKWLKKKEKKMQLLVKTLKKKNQQNQLELSKLQEKEKKTRLALQALEKKKKKNQWTLIKTKRTVGNIIRKILKNPQQQVDFVSEMLKDVDRETAIETLFPYIKNQNKMVRLFAIEALGKMCDVETVVDQENVGQYLLRNLNTDKEELEASIWALSRIKTKEAYKEILKVKKIFHKADSFHKKIATPLKYLKAVATKAQIKRFTCENPKSAHLLLPRLSANFQIDMVINFSKEGYVLDTAGTTTLVKGDLKLHIKREQLQFMIYNRNFKSKFSQTDGWHVVIIKSILNRNTNIFVSIKAKNGNYTIFKDGEEKEMNIATPLVPRPLYLGDYPQDNQGTSFRGTAEVFDVK